MLDRVLFLMKIATCNTAEFDYLIELGCLITTTALSQFNKSTDHEQKQTTAPCRQAPGT
jgi:hypothetical protein